jgi:N-methylhydantoinase B
MGAAPHRDGVNTGGHMNIPSAGITDIERIEMQYPFLYFTRSHNPDGSGFGQYRGGLGSYRIYLIYGSKDCSVDYKPYGGVAQGGFGLCGGYPTGIGATRVMIEAGLAMLDRVRSGDHPTGQAMRAGEWGKSFLPAGVPERVPLPEGSLLVDYVAGGGGFGDPIDRDPQLVLKDFGRGWVSREIAERIYGVVISRDGRAVDAGATNASRSEIRQARRRGSAPVSGKTSGVLWSPTGKPVAPSSTPVGRNPEREPLAKAGARVEGSVASDGWQTLLRFHAAMEISAGGKQRVIRCTRCGHMLCDAKENYKLYALHRARHLSEIMPPLPTGEPYIGEYHEYFCPGCATQLQVDMFSPTLGGDPILWDTRIDADKLKSH